MLDADERETAVAQAHHVVAVRRRDDCDAASHVHRRGGRGQRPCVEPLAGASVGDDQPIGLIGVTASRDERHAVAAVARRARWRRCRNAGRTTARRRRAADGAPDDTPLAADDPGVERHPPAAQGVAVHLSLDGEAACPREVGMTDVGVGRSSERQCDRTGDSKVESLAAKHGLRASVRL
jgi:hypothetical protein